TSALPILQGHLRVPRDDPDPPAAAVRHRRRGPLGERVMVGAPSFGPRGVMLRRLLNAAAAVAIVVVLFLVQSSGSVKLGQVFALFAIWGIATVSLNV